jgi:SAM-dependent methyltransferase
LHSSVREWVGVMVEKYELAKLDTLEVGSRDYNGSVKPLFIGPYVGVDMEDGPRVDGIMRADDLLFADNSFDCVVTTEMLEHDPYFWLSMAEMARVLRPGGFLIVTTRGIGFKYHEYPGDYWRFTDEAIAHLYGMVGVDVFELQQDPLPDHPGVFALGRKP